MPVKPIRPAVVPHAMRLAIRYLAALVLVLAGNSLLNAQSLLSFTVSPTSIVGDQSDFATAVAQVSVTDPHETSFPLSIQATGNGSLGLYCGAGQIFGSG